MRSLTLQKYRNVCAKCMTTYFSLHFPEDTFGPILFGTISGELRFLFPEEDETWIEISDYFQHVVTKLDEPDHERRFDKALELTVDESPQGERFYIWNRIPCPKCGSLSRSSWGPVEPPEYLQVRAQPVTHKRWHEMSDEMKSKMIGNS